MERKGPKRQRVVNLRAVPNRNQRDKLEGPVQEVVGIVLGDRVVFSEQAEVWTVRGLTKTGDLVHESIGELSFILIPGTQEPATAVIGYISPAAPYSLIVGEDVLWPQLRSMVVQLGYDIDGFYASVSIGGRAAYFEDFNAGR